MKTKDEYKQYEDKAKAHVQEVLGSDEFKKKIVVAGPGAGKTYLFKEILDDQKDNLTLTFANALVDDLSLALGQSSEVKTLHSFARGLLPGKVHIYSKLPKVIAQDAALLGADDIDPDELFRDRTTEKSPEFEFYQTRRSYYSQFGYPDLISAAVRYLEANPDKIPRYDQILVDEFQDFNKLEVDLVEMVAGDNPILLAGDDDQALYLFKSAGAEHIRERHKGTVYKDFKLPFCFRCPEVIVDAANDILKKAQEEGLLVDRIDKSYDYFHSRKKDKVSEANPKIVYTYQPYKKIPWFIANQLENIADEQREKFSVLIISPTRTCRNIIAAALRKSGFRAVSAPDREEDKEPTLFDGLKLLLQDESSNLGWRIILELQLPEPEFEAMLGKTSQANPPRLVDLVDKKQKAQVKATLKKLRTIRDKRKLTQAELEELLAELSIDPYPPALKRLEQEIPQLRKSWSAAAGIKDIPITCTTVESSKGLSADYVFITHFDDFYFLGQEKKKIKLPENQTLCNFLVALTRARHRAYLISSRDEQPTYLKWIDPERIEKLK